MTLKELFQEYSGALQKLYPKNEAESLTFLLFEEFLGKKRIDLLRNENMDKIPEALKVALWKLMAGEPIQYIIGKAPFYGREFFVNPSVLIPRNETEELVHLIIKENQQSGLKILDIGTGSGCIPISLALEMDKPSVYAIDISEDALETAIKNASELHAKVDFKILDILKEEIPFQDLDIVVSNPPYVRYSEREQMHQNVLDHEPHLALFVYDEDPLLFYRVIAEKALKVLKPGGKLYFEINEALGKDTKKLMESLGYSKVRLVKDLNDKDRMLVGIC
ncbi:peptide chain release factor N(5)-glutamine methyltransferase [Shivajiella indica]|uniref:Release factor glutamine methyltransferase n=1 Tax=Shivajiella indica TaxID=872115 RepID=A0ABW5BGA8_9BACT